MRGRMCRKGLSVKAGVGRNNAVVIEQSRQSYRDEEGDPGGLLTCWLVVGGGGGVVVEVMVVR